MTLLTEPARRVRFLLSAYMASPTAAITAHLTMLLRKWIAETQTAASFHPDSRNPASVMRSATTLFYEARDSGLPADDAQRIADRLISNRDTALDTLAREELGLDPDELGSPIGAAVSSFIAFAIGATIPVAPYVFAAGQGAFTLSAVLSAVALLTVGGSTALLTGRSILFGEAEVVVTDDGVRVARRG